MIIQALAFYVFAGIAIASGVMVITARNPVHSVLFLILAFFNAAGLFVLMGAEFLAMILVIVYVGAVAVLFLFVVMMLDINIARLREGFLQYLPVGMLIGLVLFLPVLGGNLALYSQNPSFHRIAALVFHGALIAFLGFAVVVILRDLFSKSVIKGDDVHRWQEPGDGHPEPQIRELKSRCHQTPDSFVWLGLFEPTRAEMQMVAEVFDLPPLQVEDASNDAQRPKFELDQSGCGMAILKVLDYVEATSDVRTGQIDAVHLRSFETAQRLKMSPAEAVAASSAFVKRTLELLGQ